MKWGGRVFHLDSNDANMAQGHPCGLKTHKHKKEAIFQLSPNIFGAHLPDSVSVVCFRNQVFSCFWPVQVAPPVNGLAIPSVLRFFAQKTQQPV